MPSYKHQARQIISDEELNDMGAEELRRTIQEKGLTAGVIAVVGIAETLNAKWCKPWGTGEEIRTMPIGSYLKSLGQ